MCRYVTGQKIELWHIRSKKHPHRVDERVFVTITDMPGHGTPQGTQKLIAHTSDGRQFLKIRPRGLGEGTLEIFTLWHLVSGPPEEVWLEAVQAANTAHHQSHPFHYSDGHGHDIKPLPEAWYCRRHHNWEYKGQLCPDNERVISAPYKERATTGPCQV